MLRYNNSLHDALPIYPADHVRGILDGGVLDVLDGDLVGTLVDEGSHDVPFIEEAGRGVHWRGGLTHRPSIPRGRGTAMGRGRSEEHTSELQSRGHLVCRLLLENRQN